MRVEPLEPGHIRRPRGPYGWVDLRAITDGHLEPLGTEAALVYLFCCAVANAEGISFWGRDRIGRVVGLPPEQITAALQKLRRACLIVYRERIVQVLPVPNRPVESSPAPVARDSTPRQGEAGRNGPAATEEPPPTEEEIHGQEPEARARLSRVLGQEAPLSSVVRALASDLARNARRSQKP
jgi:hypothetical protein